MSKYGFWILLAACLAAIGALYGLEVRKSGRRLEEAANRAREHASDARVLAAEAVGRDAIAGLREAQGKLLAHRDDLAGFFASRDAENLDCWFPDLRMPWKSAPRPEAFRREYQLAQDRLARETRRLLAAAGAPEVAIPLITPDELDPKAFAGPKELGAEMRRRQREFWVQDHLLLAFARQGAWPTRPLRGGESTGVSTGSGGEAVFERFRFDIQVWADPGRVLDVLHAFDAPFVHVTEDGQRIDIALNALIDNVSIRAPELDETLIATFKDRPPVQVSFYLTILDYKPESGS